MTLEMNWVNIEIEYLKPISLFDMIADKELKEAFNWIVTQPLYREIHQHKGAKINSHDCRLQFIKVYHLLVIEMVKKIFW